MKTYSSATQFPASPKVSVIIPVFNRAELLKKAIDSVLFQTYTNLEVIVVDDGSSDTSVKDVLHGYGEKIIVIFNDHSGAAKARNTGIQACTGEYVAFLDSDDFWESSKVELQLKYMMENDCYASCTPYNVLNYDETFIRCITYDDPKSIFQFPQIVGTCLIATPTVMLRAEVARQFPFSTDLSIGEDVCLWIDIAHQHRWGCLQCALTNVRICDTSAVNNIEKTLLGLTNIMRHVVSNRDYILLCYSQIGHLARAICEICDLQTSTEQLCLSHSWYITKPIRAFQYAQTNGRGIKRRWDSFLLFMNNPALDRQSDNAIHRSYYWKITAPLRILAKPFKKS